MPFDGTVLVSPVLPQGKRWKVEHAFSYTGKTDVFTIPAGFTTDFASVPRVFTWLLPRYGRWTQAAILHDYLWNQAEQPNPIIDKFDADGLFNRAMRELGVPFLRRWIMWAAVRWAAGPSTWFRRGPLPFLQMLVLSIVTLPVVLPPAAVISVGLVVGAAAEFIVYLPLRWLHRNERKQVNQPEVGEVFMS